MNNAGDEKPKAESTLFEILFESACKTAELENILIKGDCEEEMIMPLDEDGSYVMSALINGDCEFYEVFERETLASIGMGLNCSNE